MGWIRRDLSALVGVGCKQACSMRAHTLHRLPYFACLPTTSVHRTAFLYEITFSPNCSLFLFAAASRGLHTCLILIPILLLLPSLSCSLLPLISCIIQLPLVLSVMTWASSPRSALIHVWLKDTKSYTTEFRRQ